MCVRDETKMKMFPKPKLAITKLIKQALARSQIFGNL
jgi:hypothetical protein